MDQDDSLSGQLRYNLRKHAQKIRTILETPSLDVFDGEGVSIWRTTYLLDGRAVAAKIVRAPGQPVSVHVVTRHGNAYSTQNIWSQQGTSPEEMAVFLGLEDVSPDEVEWQRDSRHGKIVVSGVAANTRVRVDPGK